ncbi:MAG: hypothetical protein Q8K30_06350 [Candidatus Gracilibacteria bacterium]|nr:hypothetical protein [Candidatus Gracilibacteria bacterium]
MFVDDIEFIDISKITKIDTYTRGIIANIIGFGNLVIEQQREQVRIFNYIPDARKALHIINAEKEKIAEKDSKNKVELISELVNDSSDYDDL